MVQQFERTVILRGNVANPGRYRWTPGMRISDLIPDKDSLQTRGYWQRRIALGLPAPEYTPLFSEYRANLPSPFTPNSASSSPARRRTTAIMPLALRWQERRMRSLPNGSRAAGQTADSNPEQSGQGGAVWQILLPIRLLPTPTRPREAPAVRANSTPELRYFPPGDRFSEGQFPIKNESSSHRSQY